MWLMSMNHKKAIFYGVGIWVFMFVVAMVVFPLRMGERALFDSIMPAVLTLAVSYASIKYFGITEKKTLMVGFCLGLIWFGVSLVLDFAFFSWGSMKMSFVDYLKDISGTYAIILIIPTAFGYFIEQTNNKL